MKTLMLTLTLSLLCSSAFAESKNFAKCYGDHHGTYVDFFTDVSGKTYLETSNDGEDLPEQYEITSVSESMVDLDPANYGLAIRQALRSSAKQDGIYGMLMLKAKRGDSTLYFQINKFMGSENFISQDGYVEAMTCPLESIID